MNLDSLIAAGAFVRPGLVKKTVTWKYRDEDEKIVTCEFDIHIKKSMSAADFEYIYSPQSDDDVRMAKRVNRLVFLGENGEEVIPYAAAESMKPSLLIVLINALNEVEQAQSVKEDKKDPDSAEGDSEKN